METQPTHDPRKSAAGKRKETSLVPGPSRLMLLVLLAMLIAPFAHLLFMRASSLEHVSYSDFKSLISRDQVKAVAVSPSTVRGELKQPSQGGARFFETTRVDDPKLLEDLQIHGVNVSGISDESGLGKLLGWIWPIALGLLLLRLFSRGMGNMPGTHMMEAGQSKARIYMEKDIPVRFGDVAGVDEAKTELQEVVEFLRTPEKFARLGGHVPKGVLLVGPPGTGKTLLARAVAGESGVPFFSISGSEFVEMFVGVGAARVRDLFAKARQSAPCIIFIDELDALGKARGAGPMSHEEREQTLNQLLVEMDGFDTRSGVILMAATNRPEILDPALLRAGRFDRQVLVDRPDKAGRLAILQLHARKVKLESDADLERIASMTAGMAGAELANVINEAALLGVRRSKTEVGTEELLEAVERVVAGLEKKSRVLRPEEKERVAHHEVGHALVGLDLPGLGTLQKISIIPRGVSALGYTLQVPTEDRFLLTRTELENRIAQLMGGRAAEELIYGEESTGGADDLEKATGLARSMVLTYGMSPELGTVSLSNERRSGFLGVSEDSTAHGPDVARQIDAEVKRILDEQHARARKLLSDRIAVLRGAAKELLQKEVLIGGDLIRIASQLGAAPTLQAVQA